MLAMSSEEETCIVPLSSRETISDNDKRDSQKEPWTRVNTDRSSSFSSLVLCSSSKVKEQSRHAESRWRLTIDSLRARPAASDLLPLRIQAENDPPNTSAPRECEWAAEAESTKAEDWLKTARQGKRKRITIRSSRDGNNSSRTTGTERTDQMRWHLQSSRQSKSRRGHQWQKREIRHVGIGWWRHL